MFNFDSCGQSTQFSTIVCEENKRKFIGLNKNRKTILKVKVDGCLKKIEGKRCDWLLIDISANIAYFIELKGSDVKPIAVVGFPLGAATPQSKAFEAK